MKFVIKCEHQLFFSLFSFIFCDLVSAGAFTGCFFMDNTTESVSFYCRESTGQYPNVKCLSLFFGNTSWQLNRQTVKRLKLSECRGATLNKKLYKTFTNVQEFDFSFYGVDNISSEVLDLMAVEKLNASHNKLSRISGQIFSKSPNLTNVDFSFNKITTLFPSEFYGADKLEVMNFSHNQLQFLPVETFRLLNKLQILDLSFNFIQTIDKRQFNENLKELHVTNNLIVRLECDIFGLLFSSTSVHISWTNFKSINTNCPSDPLEIELCANNDVIFRRSNESEVLLYEKELFKNLTHLNFSGRRIQQTQKICGLLGTGVEFLDISSNFVGKLNENTFKHLVNLQHLNLSHTNLSNFGFNTFYNQRKLQILDLSFNYMKILDFTLFLRNFKQLHTLNVEGNDLTAIDSIQRSHFPNLVYLGISKNRFSCRYLATFLLPWQSLTLFENPSDQTHIDGVDCFPDRFEITSEKAELMANQREGNDTVDHLESSDFDSSDISSDNTENTNKAKLVQQFQQASISIPTSDNSTDFRVIERILLIVCITFCCFLALRRTKALEEFKQKLSHISLERNVTFKQNDGDFVLIDNGVSSNL